MRDYRDPVDPNDPRSSYTESLTDADRPWSNSTWGWIAGIAVAALVVLLVVARSPEPTQTATGPAITAPQTSPASPPALRPDLPAPGVSAPIPTPVPQRR